MESSFRPRRRQKRDPAVTSFYGPFGTDGHVLKSKANILNRDLHLALPINDLFTTHFSFDLNVNDEEDDEEDCC